MAINIVDLLLQCIIGRRMNNLPDGHFKSLIDIVWKHTLLP